MTKYEASTSNIIAGTLNLIVALVLYGYLVYSTESKAALICLACTFGYIFCRLNDIDSRVKHYLGPEKENE